MSTLERAIEIAVAAHKGQADLAGAPYILHPLRLMLNLSGEAERIVAVLHDVVEDCEGWSFERMAAEGFSAEVIEALRSVTKTDAEDRALRAAGDEESKYAVYEAFVLRAGGNAIGRRVKMADLRDNSDTSRIKSMSARDHARLGRYRRAIARLRERYPDEWRD